MSPYSGGRQRGHARGVPEKEPLARVPSTPRHRDSPLLLPRRSSTAVDRRACVERASLICGPGGGGIVFSCAPTRMRQCCSDFPARLCSPKKRRVAIHWQDTGSQMYPYIARGPASAANACSRHVFQRSSRVRFGSHRDLAQHLVVLPALASSLLASPQRVMRMKSAPVTCRKGDRE